MKKLKLISAGIIFLASILASSPLAAQEPEDAPQLKTVITPPPDNLPVINIVTCTPGDEFIKLAAQSYAQAHPDLRLRVRKGQLATAAGELAKSRIDLLLTVSLTPARPDNCVMELHKIYVAAVNPDNALENISLSRLKKIYTGGFMMWNELGGPKLPISLLGYDEESSEGRLLDVMLAGRLGDGKGVVRFGSGREIASVIATDSNAIGIFPYEYRTNGIKVLKVDSCLPAPDKPESSKYPLVARFYVSAAPKLSPQARKFIDFLKSQDAEKIYLYLSLNPIRPAAKGQKKK